MRRAITPTMSSANIQLPIDPAAHPEVERFLQRLAVATPDQRRAIAARLWDPARDAAMERAMEMLAPLASSERVRSVLVRRFGDIGSQWERADTAAGLSWTVDAPPWYGPVLDEGVGFGRLYREATLGYAAAAAMALGARAQVGDEATRALLAPFAALQLDTPPAPEAAATPPAAAPDPARDDARDGHAAAADRALAERLVAHLARERVTLWDVPQAALMRITRQQGSDVARAIVALQQAIVTHGLTAEADRLALEAARAVASHAWKSWPPVLDGPSFPGTDVPMPIVLEAMVAVQACLLRSRLPREAFEECIAPFAAWYAAEARDARDARDARAGGDA